VVDLHLVDNGEIELIENDGLGDMGRKRRVPLDHRHRTGSPAFICGWELRRAAERKGRDQLDRERGSVVVVDRNDHVGLGLRHPFLGFFEAREYPLPVGFLGLLVVDRDAD